MFANKTGWFYAEKRILGFWVHVRDSTSFDSAGAEEACRMDSLMRRISKKSILKTFKL